MADNKIEVDVELAIAKAQKDIDALTKQFTVFGQNITKQVGQADNALGVMKGTLGALGITRLFDAGVSAAKSFARGLIVDGVAAAQQAEDAVLDLNLSLAATGRYTEETSQRFQDLATELQKTTKFEDDLVIQNIALIQSLGNLSEDGLDRATRAALDLTAGLAGKGMSLSAAAQLVGKAAAGETGSLSRYGLVIEEGGTKAERFEKVLALIEDRFGGRAQAQALTYSGTIQQTGNRFGELQEKIGFIITQNPVLVRAIRSAGDLFDFLGERLDMNKAQANSFLSEGVVRLVDGLVVLLKVGDGTIRFFTALGQTIGLVANNIVTGFLMALDAVVSSISFVFDKLQVLGVSNPFKNMAGAIREELGESLVEIEGQIVDIGKSFSEQGLLGEVADYVAGANVLLKQHVGDHALTTEQILANNKRAFEIMLEREGLRRFTFLETLLLDTELTQKQIELERLRTDASQAEGAKRLEIERRIVDAENQMQKQRGENFKSTLGYIATLQKSSIKELFYIGKAAAIAQATIDGIAATQKAFNATSNYYVNVALAALTATATAANVASIASQGPGFQAGGIFQGQGLTGDGNTARINNREAVLTLEQQTNLFNAIASNKIGGGSGGGVSLHIAGNLYVDSRERITELMEAIQYEVRNNNAPFLASGLVAA